MTRSCSYRMPSMVIAPNLNLSTCMACSNRAGSTRGDLDSIARPARSTTRSVRHTSRQSTRNAVEGSGTTQTRRLVEHELAAPVEEVDEPRFSVRAIEGVVLLDLHPRQAPALGRERVVSA